MVPVSTGREEGLLSQLQHPKLRNKIILTMTNFCFVVIVLGKKIQVSLYFKTIWIEHGGASL